MQIPTYKQTLQLPTSLPFSNVLESSPIAKIKRLAKTIPFSPFNFVRHIISSTSATQSKLKEIKQIPKAPAARDLASKTEASDNSPSFLRLNINYLSAWLINKISSFTAKSKPTTEVTESSFDDDEYHSPEVNTNTKGTFSTEKKIDLSKDLDNEIEQFLSVLCFAANNNSFAPITIIDKAKNMAKDIIKEAERMKPPSIMYTDFDSKVDTVISIANRAIQIYPDKDWKYVAFNAVKAKAMLWVISDGELKINDRVTKLIALIENHLKKLKQSTSNPTESLAKASRSISVSKKHVELGHSYLAASFASLAAAELATANISEKFSKLEKTS